MLAFREDIEISVPSWQPNKKLLRLGGSSVSVPLIRTCFPARRSRFPGAGLCTVYRFLIQSLLCSQRRVSDLSAFILQKLCGMRCTLYRDLTQSWFAS